MTGSVPPAAGAELPDSSAGELVKQLSQQLSRLVRDELKLAENEMAVKGARAARGAGLFGGSGVIALFGIGCLLASAIAGLALVLATWLAALIVGAALLAVAGTAVLIGRKQLSQAVPPVPEQAVDSVKADVQAIRERVHS
jgi:Putative Actinobacterial Holin-X, holin superfamily III